MRLVTFRVADNDAPRIGGRRGAFVKLNSSLVGREARVARPRGVVRLDYEAELVFVIGRHALGLKQAEAFDRVAGVTVLNDLTCRDAQKREVASGSRFWTGKNIPGFGPLGPEIVTLDAISFEPGDMFSSGAPGGAAVGKPNAAELIATLRTHFVAP